MIGTVIRLIAKVSYFPSFLFSTFLLIPHFIGRDMSSKIIQSSIIVIFKFQTAGACTGFPYDVTAVRSPKQPTLCVFTYKEGPKFDAGGRVVSNALFTFLF